MQTQQQEIVKKTEEFIQKNKDLLTEKKFYQFAQKVKLMSHRKFQSKKINQSIVMLRLGAQTLFKIPQVQQNIPIDLVAQMIQFYTTQPSLLTQEQQKSFLNLLQKTPINPRKAQLVYTLIRKSNSKQAKRLTLVNFYVDWCMENFQYEIAEEMVSSLSDEKIEKFLQKWTQCEEILETEIPALWCRMVLLRALNNNINSAQQLFRKVGKKYPNDEPYTVFTGFLLKAVTINSKQAYATIHNSYQSFLQSDQVFLSLFTKFGQKFFGIEKKGGLLASFG